MAECLFEIFCEEIPARMQKRAGDNLVKMMDTGLKAAGLLPKDSRALTGPRRLTYITEVDTRSPDVSEERKGPRVGSPEQALAGFMRGAGLSDISQAETRQDKKGEYYVAVLQSEGRNTADILGELIPSVMGDFPWPKSMKSGDTDFRWVRPLRGLTVLLDGHSLDGITVSGIASDNLVHGHRQMGPGPFAVSNFADYQAKLEGEGHVMLDRAARRDRVLAQAKSVCADVGLELVDDDGLLDEVTGLVEWPVAILGDMDPSFLELPDEVIRLTLKSHQKTFTVRGADGKLTPSFVIMANLETPDGGATIKAGNAKVISARLSDAKFFQDQDRQKKLIDYYDQLDEVVFHKKLGSVRDKADRVAALAREIAPYVGADPDKAELAAKLAKCDLVTQTVIEATSLQGQVGRWMYEAETKAASGRLDRPAHLLDRPNPHSVETSGDGPADQVGGRQNWSEQDHADIAVAIEDHYKPQGPSNAVPTNTLAIAVALADKLDSLSEFWAIDEKPTGSKDPFALRRAALGIVRSVLENKLQWPVAASLTSTSARRLVKKAKAKIQDRERERELFEYLKSRLSYPNEELFALSAIELDTLIGGVFSFKDFLVSKGVTEADLAEWSESESRIINDLMAFVLDRLRVYLRDQGQRHDVIDSVIAQGGDDLLAISQRVDALGAFLSNSDGEDLVQGYKRAANILKAEQKKGKLELAAFDRLSGFTAQPAETLAKALTNTRPAIDIALESGDYPAALSALADLRTPIDAFFTDVVVNSDDVDERGRRLALLSAVVDTFHRIADFSRLDG